MREQEIIALLRARDERGAEELVRHYGPLMRYIIGPIVPDARDREECLSDAAMRVWEKIDRYDPERGGWNAWLTALTRNTALNRARRGRAEADDLPDGTPDPQPGPEELLLRQERREAVRRALDKLSQRERALFYRKYYYLQPTAQIARELGMSERAAEGKLYRLKRKLRKLLGGEGYE